MSVDRPFHTKVPAVGDDRVRHCGNPHGRKKGDQSLARQKTTVRLTRDIEVKLDAMAAARNRTRGNLIEMLVIEALDAAGPVTAPVTGERHIQERLPGRPATVLNLLPDVMSRLDVLAASNELSRSAMVAGIISAALKRPTKGAR